MPRRAPAERRYVPPDPIYGSTLVQRIINKIMMKGKKSVAERIFYGAMQLVAERSRQNPLEVLAQAVRNVLPVVETRSRRVGGSVYQVPMEVRPSRRISLGIRWLIQAARDRNEQTMAERLANEILDASKGQGGAVAHKDQVQRTAEANRAFAHYRW